MYRKLTCFVAAGLMLAIASGVQAEVLFEYWYDIGGTSIDGNLRTAGSFPYGPSESELRENLKSNVDWKDNYGVRARGYLTPPVDGDYTFWVSGDDNCQLWLSTDNTADNAVKIAEVAGWTPAETWDWEAGQQSAPIALVGGQSYYIEMLMKEGGGGDSVTAAWGGPEIGEGPVVIAGEYLTPYVRTYFPAYSPKPADGQQDVLMPLLEWTPGVDAVLHTVYFGDSPDALAMAIGANPTGAALYYYPLPLTPGATYYWRVDETSGTGLVSEGIVWSFTVTPLEAHFPSPYDGALWRDLDLVVSWTAGQGAVSHVAYADTDEAAVAAGDESVLLATLTETMFDATGLLEPLTTYYWRIDEVAGDGTVTEGPVWSFSTIDPEGGCLAEYWDNMYLSGAPKVVTTEAEVNFDFNAERDSRPHPDIPIDNFSCRWTAQLNVPVSGTYRFYEASDDGARMYLNGEQIAAGWYDRGTTEDASAEIELEAGRPYLLVMEMYENGGGATAYLRWSGPGIPKEIIPQGALMLPQMAYSLSPSNGAVDVDPLEVLSWSAGDMAVSYNVYLSKDGALVAAGDESVLVAQQAETSFAPAEPFDRGTTNFWRIDVVTADGTVIPGYVSSFRIADMNTDNWAVGVGAAEPNYLDTFVENGTYDIGAFGDEMTYEFVVRSNPAETMTSMCLIGRLNFGDTRAGLKYEQWENTGTYGATLFGVTDYDYGVANAPGEYTHLVFVASTAAGTTDLYVNGELQGSVPAAILLSGSVGIGRAIREDGTFVDNFDGDIFGVAIYDRLLTADEIAANADKYFNPIPIMDPNLLIYYDFETGSGRTVIDQSGHGNHSLFMGSPDWTKGIFGGCLSIDSASLDYVQTKAPLGIVSNTVSVTGWVKHDQTPAAWSGILTHRGTSPGCIGLQHNGLEGPLGAELRYMWGADEYWSFSSGLLIPNGEWYFAALTIAPDQAKLYLNGIDQTAVNVAEHVPTNFDSLIRVGRDHNDSRIMTCLIDEVRFYDRTLTDADIQRLVLPDVTAPGDTVQGVPNDGDWPAAEYPALAIDNTASTKYLHFKGGSMATGFQVEPAIGPTIVTGLTFTTANDDYGRDPTTFELSGSNDSIDGPWTVIAAGEIVDFAQEALWPRFTMNATPITFENAVAYKYYQVTFPSVDRPNNDGLMQIAEVELLGLPAPLFFEDFESYEAGSDLHGQGGWKGWDNTASAGAPASSAQAYSGVNSVEVIGSADLVHEYDIAGGVRTFSAMQYIPSGTTGTTYFILLNSYDDGANQDWSVQTTFDLAAGTVGYWHGGSAQIVYDQWVELKYVIDLDNNTVDKYYNGQFIVTDVWDDNVHGTIGAIDLFGNGASSVYYDDILIK